MATSGSEDGLVLKPRFSSADDVSNGDDDEHESVDVEIITDGMLHLGSGATGLSTFVQRAAFDRHMVYLSKAHPDSLYNGHDEETKTTPLFSGHLLRNCSRELIPQYGLLAARMPVDEEDLIDLIDVNGSMEAKKPSQAAHLLSCELDGQANDEASKPSKMSPHALDPRIFLNISTPWSAFLCGSQGSGKSHTLSCMLENSLIDTGLGKLPHPLAAMVFHYDRFTSYASSQVCEAAYLCSSGIPVRILVSPTNYWRMKTAYENLPGISRNAPKPEVVAMRFSESQLDVSRMMNLMSVSDKSGPTPLYIEVILRILRQMAIDSRGSPGLNLSEFEHQLDQEGFSGQQNGPLKLRLDLLKSFMDPTLVPGSQAAMNQSFSRTKAGKRAEVRFVDELRQENLRKEEAWNFKSGTLTIVDLSCPFVDDSAACALFTICLELFLENRSNAGRIVALDEAHKYMTGTAAADNFTENLLQVIRQQRHLATRVIIATQEPTISPKLLDLSTMTIVHRFTSPDWMRALQAHLAGLSGLEENTRDIKAIFQSIVTLDAGEALLFAPTAMLGLATEEEEKDETDVPSSDASNSKGNRAAEIVRVKKLGMTYAKIRVRKRVTTDGGRSVMAI